MVWMVQQQCHSLESYMQEASRSFFYTFSRSSQGYGRSQRLERDLGSAELGVHWGRRWVQNVVTLSGVLYVRCFCFGLDKVLMDIGVLHSIFISRDLVDKRGGSLAREGYICFWRSKTERHQDRWSKRPNDLRLKWYYKLLISSLLQPQVISASVICLVRRWYVDCQTS